MNEEHKQQTKTINWVWTYNLLSQQYCWQHVVQQCYQHVVDVVQHVPVANYKTLTFCSRGIFYTITTDESQYPTSIVTYYERAWFKDYAKQLCLHKTTVNLCLLTYIHIMH